MPNLYECGVLGIAATSGATAATIHTGSTLRATIYEMGFFNTAATAASIELIRPANSPVASTSTLGQAQDTNAPAATVNVDTAWSTAPTISTNVPLRSAVLAATIGTGIIWTWPNGLILPVSSYLVLWNFGAGTMGIGALYFVWSEGG